MFLIEFSCAVLSGVLALAFPTAVVGPSGTGKTTISSLLPRFYEIDSGRVTIDRIDIREMTPASSRREIGIVQQDVFLCAGTIRENIAQYGPW